ncbi:unnamed protein product [Clavelina lepadiformis]|uniref:Uncharacterized protein n=1 Tax=Clavelina lepadiformis TaxID=159417 RepID=A0ABP0GIH6_CLALP
MNDQIREDFHKEVNWCIEQLRMGMFTKNPSKQQVQECERVIRILTSSKAPLVKKRQAMRQMFGDYRKKIEAEERKWHEAMMKQMQALKISNVEDITGTFLKQSATHSMSSTGSGRRNSSIDDLQEKLFEDPSEKNTDNNETNRSINRKIADERQQAICLTTITMQLPLDYLQAIDVANAEVFIYDPLGREKIIAPLITTNFT